MSVTTATIDQGAAESSRGRADSADHRNPVAPKPAPEPPRPILRASLPASELEGEGYGTKAGINGTRVTVDAEAEVAPKVVLDEATVWTIKYLNHFWGLDNAAIGRRLNLPRTTVRDVVLDKTQRWSHVQPWLLGGHLTEVLVRDLTPALMRADGHAGDFRKASDQELEKLLKIKLVEKVNEYLIADSDRQRLDNIVDIMEVFYTLARGMGQTMIDLERRRSNKVKSLGTYAEGQVFQLPADFEYTS